MNISSLNELLQTQIINEGSPSSVSGFARKISQCKASYAFFSNDDDEIKEAVKIGAFVIVSEKECEITDKEVFFLQAKSLKKAIAKLLRFLSEEKNVEFLLCKGLELDFCEAFGIKKLSGDIYEDFDTLLSAKNNSLFAFDDEEYLLQFCAACNEIAEFKGAKITHYSLFYSQIELENDKIFKLKLCFAYAQIFANFANFMAQKEFKFSFNEKKINCYQIFFVDNTNFIRDFGKTQKAFIVVQDERHFLHLGEALSKVKGFKVASNESLFCDFSYRTLSELKNFHAFRYCLVRADESEFISLFSPPTKEISLFDEPNTNELNSNKPDTNEPNALQNSQKPLPTHNANSNSTPNSQTEANLFD